MDIYVSNSEELSNALNTSNSGYNIILRDGEYGDLNLKNLNFSSETTITTQTGDNAIFSSIDIDSCSNLTFDGIELYHVRGPNDPHYIKAFEITNSDSITVTNSNLHGTEDGNYDNDAYMLSVQSCSNIEVSNNDIHDAFRGGIYGNVDGLVVEGNTLHHIRTDGFDFTIVNHVQITNNSFTDFHRNAEEGDHPDGIQFWANNGDSTDVLISGNSFMVGDGIAYQSIFIESDVPGNGYEDFTITNNLIYNAHHHGITVTDGSGITIESNTVLAIPGEDKTPSIRVLRDDGSAIVNNNISPSLEIENEISSFNNNIVVQYDDPAAGNYIGNMFFDPFAGPSADIASLTPLPESILFTQDGVIGALDYDSVSDHLIARSVAETYKGSSDSLSVSVSGEHSVHSNGQLSENQAEFVWDFGDGTIIEGLNAHHTYKTPGNYAIQLTVTSNGEISTSESHITVSDPHLLEMSHIIDLSPNINGVNYVNNTETDHLNFTGEGYLDLGHPKEMLQPLDELYVSLKIQTGDEGVGTQRIFWNHQRYTIEAKGDDLQFVIYTNDGEKHLITAKDAGIHDGDWHDIGFTFNSSTGEFSAQIDGNEVGRISDIQGNISSPGSVISIGGTPWGKNFDGNISELEIWSAPEPMEQTSPAENDIGFLPSGEFIVTDPVFELDQEITSETIETFGTANFAQNGIVFNGDGYANLGKKLELVVSEELFTSFDISSDDASQKGTVLWNHRQYGVKLNGDDVIFSVFNTDGQRYNIVVKDTEIADGKTHNISFSIDATSNTFTAYIDGIEVGTRSDIQGSLSFEPGNSIFLGGTPWGRHFDGELSDLQVWDTTEVASSHLEWVRENLSLTTVAVEEIELDTALSLSAAEPEPTPDINTTILEGQFRNLDSELGADDIIGDAQLTDDVFTFSGNGYVSFGQPSELTTGESFTIQFDFSTDTSANARVMWSHMKFGIEQSGDQLQIRAFSDDGSSHTVPIKDINIADGSSHNLVITYNSDTNELVTFIDNQEVASVDNINLNMSNKDLWLGGTPWGKEFEGTVSNIEIAQESIYPSTMESPDHPPLPTEEILVENITNTDEETDGINYSSPSDDLLI